jgi:hypothetical protein
VKPKELPPRASQGRPIQNGRHEDEQVHEDDNEDDDYEDHHGAANHAENKPSW